MTGPTKSPESRLRARRLNVVYVISFLTPAAIMTLAVFGLGRLLPRHVGVPAIVVGLVLIVLAACDLRLGPLRTPGASRQTDPAWRLRFGIGTATALWGLDIGTTVSTIKMTSLYWAALVVLVWVSPPRPELAVAFFAAGYVVSHLAGVWRITRGVKLGAAISWANFQVARVRIISGIILACVGVLISVQAILGWRG